MKKVVAIFIAFYFLAMGTMFVWGFIDKQQKERGLESKLGTAQQENEPAEEEDNSDNDGEKSNIQTLQNQQPQSTTSGNSQPSTGSLAKTYSWTEVAKHSKANDCWIVINGKAYDVTTYLDLHPGGADLILTQCGKDATNAFNTQGGRGRGHSSKADKQLETFLLGTISG